jgi:iron complex outermembrane receptor protein
MSRTVSLSLRFATAVLGLWFAAMDAASAQDNARKYQIAEQSLGQALREFALTSNLDLLFSPDLVAGRKSAKLDGKFTVDEGLRTLLRGSGLEFSVSGSRVVISEANSAPARQAIAPTTSAISGTNGYTRLAHAEGAEGSEQGGAQPPGPTEGERQNGTVELEEIVVTGTHIRGVSPGSSPVSVYTAADIQRSGASTIEQFIFRLPANQSSLSSNASGATGGASEFNANNVNGIDLRGLGVGSTLVLLNGRRLALGAGDRTPDISMIPLAAIDRVEVLTDGASAIYGSDAVGGVVNFILKSHFEGAESSASYGSVTSGSQSDGQVTQSFGHAWEGGRALASLNYFHRSQLSASERSYSEAANPFSLVPSDVRKGALITFDQSLSDFIFFGDALYSHRDNKSTISRSALNLRQDFRTEEESKFGQLGVRRNVFSDIEFALVASYSSLRTTEGGGETDLSTNTFSPFDNEDRSTTYDFTAKVDGPLMSLPAGKLMFSAGIGRTADGYDSVTGVSLDRKVNSAFGELVVPLIGETQHIPAVHRLELNLAARYSDYSDCGSNTSPKIGLVWEPVADLRFRATHGRSFRAPPLSRLDPAKSSWIFFRPAQLGVPDIWTSDNSATMLFSTGTGNPTLGPERATTDTIGLDFLPGQIPGLVVRASYFRISYRGRVAIGDPSGGAALFNPAQFPDLFLVNPTAEQVAAVIDHSPLTFDTVGVDPNDPASVAAQTAVIFDNRTRNLSESEMNGVDFALDYKWGAFVLGSQATYIRHYIQRITPHAPDTTRVDTLFNPADLKVRTFLSYTKDRLSGQLNMNYIDGYRNPLDAVRSHVSSWTTFDLATAYNFAHDLSLGLDIQNLFDRDPPFVSTSTIPNQGLLEPIGFDPTNANALGRFISVRISKRW